MRGTVVDPTDRATRYALCRALGAGSAVCVFQAAPWALSRRCSVRRRGELSAHVARCALRDGGLGYADGSALVGVTLDAAPQEASRVELRRQDTVAASDSRRGAINYRRGSRRPDASRERCEKRARDLAACTLPASRAACQSLRGSFSRAAAPAGQTQEDKISRFRVAPAVAHASAGARGRAARAHKGRRLRAVTHTVSSEFRLSCELCL